MPYPSYVDPDEEIAQALKARGNYPITVFVTRTARSRSSSRAPYRDKAALEADIDRYAAA